MAGREKRQAEGRRVEERREPVAPLHVTCPSSCVGKCGVWQSHVPWARQFIWPYKRRTKNNTFAPSIQHHTYHNIISIAVINGIVGRQ